MRATTPATAHSPASIAPPPASPEAMRRIAGATPSSPMVTKSPAPRERISQASSETSPQDMPAMTVRSDEHTSELQSLMRISYAVFCLKKKRRQIQQLDDSLSYIQIFHS